MAVLEDTVTKNSSRPSEDKEADASSHHVMRHARTYRLMLFASVFCCIIIFFVISMAFVPPQFYQSVADKRSNDQSVAGRFVTQVAAVTNQLRQDKKWGISVRENEINAWLGHDLPRNHPDLLKTTLWGRLSRPCIKLEPQLVRIGIEVSTWGVTAVAWADVEVRLKSSNQFALTVRRAGLGQLPLPRNAILEECSKTLKIAGMHTEMQRFRDRTLLLATVPEQLSHSVLLNPENQTARHWQVDSLRIDHGSVTVAGKSHTAKNSHDFSDVLP